jgi:putative membrane protein
VSVPEPGDWGGTWLGWELVAIWVAAITGFVLGSFLASRVDMLRQLATPAAEMEEEVVERASLVFQTMRLRKTRGQNALLLYVSLFEHRAVVLADEGIMAVLHEEGVEDLCDLLTAQMAKGSVADALEATIAEAGRRLAGVMAKPPDDTNEQPDKVILLP